MFKIFYIQTKSQELKMKNYIIIGAKIKHIAYLKHTQLFKTPQEIIGDYW